jgi:hypothetical protein
MADAVRTYAGQVKAFFSTLRLSSVWLGRNTNVLLSAWGW